jgi:hypothetical protein
VVVVLGETLTVELLKFPGIHVKVVPVTVLVALNELVEPLQITAGVAVVEITGFGLTVTVTVLEPVHPAAEPVIV